MGFLCPAGVLLENSCLAQRRRNAISRRDAEVAGKGNSMTMKSMKGMERDERRLVRLWVSLQCHCVLHVVAVWISPLSALSAPLRGQSCCEGVSMNKGRVWKNGDDVNTDVIFPGKYTYQPKWRDTPLIAEADCGLCSYVSSKTRLCARKGFDGSVSGCLLSAPCDGESEGTGRFTAHRIPPFAASSAWSGTARGLDRAASWM